MPTTETIEVKDLSLDLKNYRTVPQKTEAAALHAMESISPDWFWGLMDSLLEDGYHPTENIIVQKVGRTLTVREGNRRIAALKLAHGLVRGTNLAIPQNIKDRIKALPAEWKQQNLTVPCAVYAVSERAAADRVVSLTHGKADKAGRRPWEAVARARHNRDEEGGSEPGLDLLEAYLKSGKNLSGDQAERWAGAYPLTVLDEAVKRLAPRLSLASSREVAKSYPKKLKAAFDAMLFDIGMGGLQFSGIRDQHTDFAAKYGFPLPPAPPAPAPSRRWRFRRQCRRKWGQWTTGRVGLTHRPLAGFRAVGRAEYCPRSKDRDCGRRQHRPSFRHAQVEGLQADRCQPGEGSRSLDGGSRAEAGEFPASVLLSPAQHVRDFC